MNEFTINNAQYTACEGIEGETTVGLVAVIDGIQMAVPLDPANRHYAAIQEWVAEGNTIQEAEE